MPVASIIICTRNRAESLRETLESARQLHVPPDVRAELLVVDNGSRDHTAAVVNTFAAVGAAYDIPVRYLMESRRGQVEARNAGMAATSGDIILFTDDDVRPPPNWLDIMCRPILLGRADAIVGAVRLAPHLNRPWMSSLHRTWLACTEQLSSTDPASLIGANMAFHRRVLDKVPGFDSELGPGALGFSDEILFSRQLKIAGFRICSSFEAYVEHHCEAERLTPESYRRRAEGEGRSLAYVAHHWEHSRVTRPRTRLLTTSIRLQRDRILRSLRGRRSREAVSDEELKQRVHLGFLKQFLIERRKVRNYEHLGLVKHGTAQLNAPAAPQPSVSMRSGRETELRLIPAEQN